MRFFCKMKQVMNSPDIEWDGNSTKLFGEFPKSKLGKREAYFVAMQRKRANC